MSGWYKITGLGSWTCARSTPISWSCRCGSSRTAALQRARELGAQHADFRLERVRSEALSLYDTRLEGAVDADDLGYAVRVVKDGTWGFAAGIHLTPEAAAVVAEQAVRVAEVSAPINREPIELAAEPVHAGAVWGVGVRRGPVRGARGRQGGAAGGVVGRAAQGRRPRVGTAAAGQGAEVLRRHGPAR
ncbi:hypothetical protein GCM10020220_115270 [Nonomuraea rubra]